MARFRHIYTMKKMLTTEAFGQPGGNGRARHLPGGRDRLRRLFRERSLEGGADSINYMQYLQKNIGMGRCTQTKIILAFILLYCRMSMDTEKVRKSTALLLGRYHALFDPFKTHLQFSQRRPAGRHRIAGGGMAASV
jgi:hypothetical protein